MATYVMANPVHIERFNRSIMRLRLPDHLRPANYVTDFYYGTITHPTTGYAALVVQDNDKDIRIHAEADGLLLREMLDIFVADAAMTQQESDDLFDAVVAAKGSSLNILDHIPASWEPHVLTEAEADAAGWFPDPEV